MRLMKYCLIGSAILLLSSCGKPAGLEGIYSCVGGDRFQFRDPGIITYLRNHHQDPYVIDGDRLIILRDADKEPEGSNIKREYLIDGDRITDAKNENFFCDKGEVAPDPLPPKPEDLAKAPEKIRPGKEVPEVLSIRLGDSLEAVRQKLTTMDRPFNEVNQVLVTEKPSEIFEQVAFGRSDAEGSDTITVFLSPPPQRVISIERSNLTSGTGFDWEKLMATLESKFGKTTELVTNGNQNSWFLNKAGQPIDPPPYARECSGTLESDPVRAKRCGTMLIYWSADPFGQPIRSFKQTLIDNPARYEAGQRWNEIIRKAQEEELKQQKSGDLPNL